MTRFGFIVFIIGVVSLRATISLGDERIWLKAEINGKPAHLCFDSGSSVSALCPQAVRKLGLKFIPTSTNRFPATVLAGYTESCMMTLEGTEEKNSFLVLNLPPYVYGNVDFDGLIGWWNIKQNVLRIDAIKRKITFLSKVPKQAAKWTRVSILTNSDTLDLQVPYGVHTNGIVCIDTGNSGGLALPVKEWRRWKETHPQNPVTLKTEFTPEDGFYLREEAWADQISVGPLVLTDVPITQAGPASEANWGVQYEGTLGLAALKRLDFIVDGNNGLAYLRTKKTPPPAYPHNRLGAVFVPTSAQTNQAVARVVEGGPAYEAGVRSGDVLLQVDEIPVTGWNNTWLSRFCLPAGTKLKLTLKRDGKIFNTTATLRDILQPSLSRKNDRKS